RVEAEDEHVIVNGSKVRDVRVRVELSPFKNVIRNLYFAIEKSEALFSDKPASIHELFLELHRRDVAQRVVILEVLMDVIAVSTNDKDVAAFAILIRSCVTDD